MPSADIEKLPSSSRPPNGRGGRPGAASFAPAAPLHGQAELIPLPISCAGAPGVIARRRKSSPVRRGPLRQDQIAAVRRLCFTGLTRISQRLPGIFRNGELCVFDRVTGDAPGHKIWKPGFPQRVSRFGRTGHLRHTCWPSNFAPLRTLISSTLRVTTRHSQAAELAKGAETAVAR
jgi:hypothetical protein